MPWTTSTVGYVGKTSAGTLEVTNGALSSFGSYIGYNTGSAGTVTITNGSSSWTSLGGIYIGHNGNGTLNITNGGAVSTYGACRIADVAGGTGVVNVDGGSTWTVGPDASSGLYIGDPGSGTLTISNGGLVTSGNATWIGAGGVINFGTGGGTLTTATLAASASQLIGSGIINTHGWITDDRMVLDSVQNTKTLTFKSQPNQNITVNLDLSTLSSGIYPDSCGRLGAGWIGNGSLTIKNGSKVKSYSGEMGERAGSTGIVTVDGAGTRWDTATLSVGLSGQGTLSITGGGTVSASSLSISSGSVLAIDVGRGSRLN
jgi:T5SS/PEP-CTERM-associated repeat protein